MNDIEDIDPMKSLHVMEKYGPLYAEAKSNKGYIEKYLKSKKALLFIDAPKGTVESRLSYAYAHPDYIELLDGFKVAIENEEKAKFKLKTAELAVEIWRTRQSDKRNELKANGVN